METYWEPPNGHAPHASAVKYESDTTVSGYTYCTENGLNFSASGAAYSEDDADFPSGRRGKASRQDPLSHRIIEKRRRDRMNSCLADLSRLIPPQYQRKGRGRIEKTEIIEMSIRYMKQLQTQDMMQRDAMFKMGYDECLQEAARFLFNGHRDVCYQMVDHLKEFVKGDLFKSRNHTDSMSASSGSSPPTQHNYHHHLHPIAPLNQLRDMLVTSDHDQNSNSIDHNDVKDLSLRGQPQQAPVITSTAPAIHLDNSSNHDFDSSASRSSSVHLENGNSPQHHHNGNSSGSSGGGSVNGISNGVINGGGSNGVGGNGGSSGGGGNIVISDNSSNTGGVLRTVRMRKLSDSCHHDNEHINNSYKFKNYIQQRFSQDNHLHHHDDSSVITDCSNKSPSPSSVVDNVLLPSTAAPTSAYKKPKLCMNNFNESSCDEKPTTNGITTDFKTELNAFPIFSKPSPTVSCHNANIIIHNPVPIFALHSLGRYYVPLNVEYDALLPYIGETDLLEKNCASSQMPPLHNININVNFMTGNSTPVSSASLTSSSTLLSSSSLSSSRLKTGTVCQPSLRTKVDLNNWCV